ncbi:MAG: sulfate adenylyltransferase subunit CysN [Chloroflexi bacterium]|nr:sulfate adenylyltransferase subunit CysN [Chloroflexota bacterium]
MDNGDVLSHDARNDLLRFTLVGSVDDGKSTLIGRLLHDASGVHEDQLASIRKASERKGMTGDEIDFSLITDGLKAEREQGITIDVAYRYFTTPRRKFIIADTPGHEQYTRNMVTGASTADLAVILLDARHGALPQSRRHGFVASLLGVSHMVVAVNKMDLVGYSHDVFERVRVEYAAFAAKLQVHDTSFIPISALCGDNVVERSARMPWYQGSTLLNYLETVHIASDRNLIDLRFPIQYVLSAQQDFRGYCGSVASGVLRRGDEVLGLPSGQRTRIKTVVTFDGEIDEAYPPQAVTLTLEDDIDLSRGDMLVHPNNLPNLDETIDTMLVWMDEDASEAGKRYLIKQTTRMVPAVLTKVHYAIDVNTLHRKQSERLNLNDIGRAVMELRRPLLTDTYAKNRATGSLILVDRMTNRTVAAGMIIDRDPAVKSARSSFTVPPLKSAQFAERSGDVLRVDRERLLGQKGAVLWFTGLSGSGKSTLALAVEKRLMGEGRLAYILDGDNLRNSLCADLAFSPEDRAENIRRAGEVAALFADAGVITLAAFISPYRADRERVRGLLPEGRFFEIFLDVPLEICEGRDPKGLYRKARAGQLRDFTGFDAPYEPPVCPDLTLATHQLSLDEAIHRIEALLESRGIVETSGRYES